MVYLSYFTAHKAAKTSYNISKLESVKVGGCWHKKQPANTQTNEENFNSEHPVHKLKCPRHLLSLSPSQNRTWVKYAQRVWLQVWGCLKELSGFCLLVKQLFSDFLDGLFWLWLCGSMNSTATYC